MARTTIEVLGSRIERLKRKVDRLTKDAERYQWLKSKMHCEYGYPHFEYRHWCGIYSKTENFERTIDAKIKKEKENGNDKERLRTGSQRNKVAEATDAR